MEPIKLEPQRFVAGEWEPAARPVERFDGAAAPDALRVLTWNVWFGGHMFEERRAALLDELGRRRPEIILLQEVTPELLETIVETDWVRAGYALSDVDGSTLGGYGVLLLSRLPLARLRLLPLPSEMGRALLVAELACGLTVATIHLESTAPCVAERVAQLAIIQPYLFGKSEDVLLAGDMNFAPDAAREQAALDPTLVDLWPALRDGEPGFTIDSQINLMRLQVKSRPTRRRIDRMFLRSRCWEGAAIELVGTAPIDAAQTFISDHFGLETRLRLRLRKDSDEVT